MNHLKIFKSANLVGHRNPVYALEMESIGSFFTAGNDRGIVEWDLSPMVFKRVLCPVHTTVYRLHQLPGRKLLAAGMQDGSVIVVDTDSGNIQTRLQLHDKAVFGLGSLLGTAETSPKLVVAAEDGKASLWNMETLRLDHDRKISESPVRCLAISPDGEWVGFGTKDGCIHLCHAVDFSLHQQWKAHDTTVTSLRFSPDGRYLLSGGRDAKMNVYNVDDLNLHSEFVPHLYAIYAIRYHPEQPVFATASRDKSIKLWSAVDFRLLRTINNEKGFEGHLHSVNDLAWSANGQQLFSVGDDRVVMVWDVNFD